MQDLNNMMIWEDGCHITPPRDETPAAPKEEIDKLVVKT